MIPCTLRTLLLLLVATLTGCGGGSGETAASGIEGSGVGPTHITSSGAITATGSIFVNDVEYDLGGATIRIDGSAASEADLAVGGVVIVEGDLDAAGSTGKANRVSAGISVAGRIDAIDQAALRLTILSQVIIVDANTRFANAAGGQPMGGLHVGDDIEVMGFADSTGVLSARHIAPRKAGTPLRVTGYATQVDVTQHRFVINGRTINYSNATLAGVSEGALAGAPVRVDADDLDPQGALLATDVVYRTPGLPGNAGDAAALQGWVTRFASNSDFDVDGHPVVTTSKTTVNGPENETTSIVRLDAFIEVKGRLLANGVVQASEILTNNLVSLDSVIWWRDEQSIVANLWQKSTSTCKTTAGTAVSIDGVPATLSALQVGDVATIYEHRVGTVAAEKDSTCEIVAVEHNVRGPLESKPTDSLSFYVMGQRVWMDPRTDFVFSTADGVQTGFNTFDSLKVGDIVEVSGHTTAEGDVLATGVHIAATDGPYRVIGLARGVSDSSKQFQLGNLTVNYQDAELAGFSASGLAERDRVLVLASAPPNSGALQADVVRFTGDLPRGTTMNFVRYNGLVTRYAAADDFDLEGRRLVPAQPQWGDAEAGNRCDMSKVHANLSSMFMLGLGWGPGQVAHFGAAFCPPGRTLDTQGTNGFGKGPINVSGIVQSIDEEKLVIRMAGFDLPLQPATRFTHFEPSSDSSMGVLTPMSLDDVHVGDRVGVVSELVAGRGAATDVWLGDAALPTGDLVIKNRLDSAAKPEVVLYSGIRVQVTTDTVFTRAQCAFPARTATPSEFWAGIEQLKGQPLEVSVTRSADELVAQRIEWTDCPDLAVDAGPDQTVVAGDEVVLEGSERSGYDLCDGPCTYYVHWSQVAGPSVDLTAQDEWRVEFVAPEVVDEVVLVFELNVAAGDEKGRGTVSIHVLPAQ